jgi:hypothetical protein
MRFTEMKSHNILILYGHQVAAAVVAAAVVVVVVVVVSHIIC